MKWWIGQVCGWAATAIEWAEATVYWAASAALIAFLIWGFTTSWGACGFLEACSGYGAGETLEDVCAYTADCRP